MKFGQFPCFPWGMRPANKDASGKKSSMLHFPKANCVNRAVVCDGKKNCPEGHDEMNCGMKLQNKLTSAFLFFEILIQQKIC